jgi:magnesium-transporting ATPase (P-type)
VSEETVGRPQHSTSVTSVGTAGTAGTVATVATAASAEGSIEGVVDASEYFPRPKPRRRWGGVLGLQSRPVAEGSESGQSGRKSKRVSEVAKAVPSAMPSVDFEGDAELFAALRGEEGAEQRERVVDFFLLLALCHTVVMESVEGRTVLSAASPDEAALVGASTHFGLEFLSNVDGVVTLRDTMGTAPIERTFVIRDVLEFTSARKRMSVVVQEPLTKTMRVLSKGADNVMLPLLARREGSERLWRTTEEHMREHANDGLRTLVLGHRPLASSDYEAWSAKCVSRSRLTFLISARS